MQGAAGLSLPRSFHGGWLRALAAAVDHGLRHDPALAALTALTALAALTAAVGRRGGHCALRLTAAVRQETCATVRRGGGREGGRGSHTTVGCGCGRRGGEGSTVAGGTAVSGQRQWGGVRVVRERCWQRGRLQHGAVAAQLVRPVRKRAAFTVAASAHLRSK